MNPATYLQLETNLSLRLRKAWAELASETHTEMQVMMAAGDFDAARGLVDTIDLAPVAKVNSEYIKYTLWAFAVLGASRANDKPNIKGGWFDKTIGHATDMLVQSIALNSSDRVRKEALQSIAEAELDYQKTQKADKLRYVDDFVSFIAEGDESMQLVSSLHSTRLTVWGFTAEADFLGIQKYRLNAQMDGRTSKYCRLINGKVFSVADATSSIHTILQAQDPEDLRVLQPWPKQDKASLANIQKMSADELVTLNLHIPPFHPKCRTMLDKLAKDKPKLTMQLPAPEPEAEPSFVASLEDFTELGAKLTTEQVDHWNAHIGKEPAQVLATLSGISALEVLDGYLAGKIPIQIKKNGTITFKAKNKAIVADSQAAFDPFTGTFHLDYAELKHKNPAAVSQYFKELHGNMLATASVVQAGLFTVEAAGAAGAYSYAKLGFLPNVKAWFELKEDLLLVMNRPDVKAAFPEDRFNAIIAILNNSDPKALKALVDLPFKYKGQSVGKVLLFGHKLVMGVEVG